MFLVHHAHHIHTYVCASPLGIAVTGDNFPPWGRTCAGGAAPHVACCGPPGGCRILIGEKGLIAIGGLLFTGALLLLFWRIASPVSCCCFEGGVGRLLLLMLLCAWRMFELWICVNQLLPVYYARVASWSPPTAVECRYLPANNTGSIPDTGTIGYSSYHG